tara:strand:+ start:390 stop:848 length:459 start_codon:yes stop_codon:yes gene_type:complete
MTDILYKRLKERFPYGTISVYGADERIEMFVSDKKFYENNSILSSKKVEELALRIFDVNFSFKNTEDSNYLLYFKPNLNPLGDRGLKWEDPEVQYQLNYDSHFFKMNLGLETVINMVIATGWRGAFKLFDEQRDKYLNFVEGISNLLIGNEK